MIIRPARSAELDVLAAVAHKAKAEWGYEPELIEAWTDELTPTGASLRENPTFVAEVDGKVAGFYQVSFDVRRTAEVDPTSRAASAELEHLWIHPAFWRRGIGRSLLEHAIGLLADAGVEALDIDPDPNAAPFYIACGAVRVGEKPAPIAGDAARIRPQLRLAIMRRSH